MIKDISRTLVHLVFLGFVIASVFEIYVSYIEVKQEVNDIKKELQVIKKDYEVHHTREGDGTI